MHWRIGHFFIIITSFTFAGCHRLPTSDAQYEVLRLLQHEGHEEALRSVDRVLQKKPRDRQALEVKLLLQLGDEGTGSRAEILKTQEAIEAMGGGRYLLYDQAHNRLSRVRQQTAYALGALGDPAALDLLKTLAEDDEERVRAEAIHALGKLNRPEAKYLLMIHLRDGDWKVRSEAADALAKLGDASVTAQLFRAVDDKDDYARMQMLGAILQLARPEQVKIYLQAIQSENVYEKTAGALALGKLRRLEAPSVLLELLKNKETPERIRIAQTLLTFGSEAMSASLKDLFKRERDPQVKALFEDYFDRQEKAAKLLESPK